MVLTFEGMYFLFEFSIDFCARLPFLSFVSSSFYITNFPSSYNIYISRWPARNVAQCLVQGELACKLTVYHDPQLQKLLTWENFGYSSTGNTLQNESGVRQHKYMILRVDGPSHGQSTDDQTLGIVLRNGRVHSVTPDSPAGKQIIPNMFESVNLLIEYLNEFSEIYLYNPFTHKRLFDFFFI